MLNALKLEVINKVDKKIRFFITSGLFFLLLNAFIYYKSFGLINLFIIGMALILISSVFVNYPNLKLDGISISLIMPGHLLLGSLLFLHYFPNFGDIFRLLIILIFSIIYYIILAADNIFLVVHDRGEIIPLYRAAITWSLILIIITAIPLYSGYFKIVLNPYLGLILTIISTFMFNYYQIWISKYDDDAKNLRAGESFQLSLFVVFIVLSAMISSMFIPAEPFLRAIFVASVLMFGLNYTNSYLKNTTTKSLLLEYFIISFIFLGLLLLFTN